MKWSRTQPESALRIHVTLALALMFQLTGGMKAKAEDFIANGTTLDQSAFISKKRPL
jgi:hypothetical protein